MWCMTRKKNTFAPIFHLYIILAILTERHIILDNISPASLYGPGNVHLRLLKSLYPKLRIMARDNVMRVLGGEEETSVFCERMEIVCRHLTRYNTITEEQLLQLATGREFSGKKDNDVIVYNMSGKPIKSRTANQQQIVDAYQASDLLFVTGPAGTGKTYLGIALAVRALKEKQARRIILSRPAVEAGEKLGFLPGDMKEKIDPYLQPLYDALLDMIPAVRLEEMIEKHVIEIAPLAFMRGRTLNDAVVILDEAQNTTPSQLRMFLTRMGNNTKMIVTGDLTQVDLPKGQLTGLRHAITILKDIDGIAFVRLDTSDIVRHRLVTRIVNAYEKEESERRGERGARKEDSFDSEKLKD